MDYNQIRHGRRKSGTNYSILLMFSPLTISPIQYSWDSQRCVRSSGRLPSKVIFHQMSSSAKSRLPSKVVFHQMSSSIKGRLPSTVTDCNVYTHANITLLFLTELCALFMLCVHMYCTLSVTVQFSANTY